MKRLGYLGTLLLLLAAGIALLILGGPVAPADPVQLAWPLDAPPATPLVLRSVRTMNETAFFKVRGLLQNRGVVPIGPVVARGRFRDRSGGESVAMALTTPEVVVPGAAARFEIVVPDRPETARVEIDFRDLAGAPLPVAGTHVATDGEALP